MPYSNIVFVKLYWKELLHQDTRFIEQLNDSQKGLFLMLFILMGATHNNIKDDPNYLKRTLNLQEKTEKITENLEFILKTFPKLIRRNGYLKFRNFKKLHNPIRHAEGTPKGTPEESPEKKRIDKEKNRYICNYFSEVHKRETGVSYPINYGKDKRLIYGLLEVYDQPTLTTLINTFFDEAKDPKCWWSDKLSIGVFKSVIPNIIGRLRKK